MEYPKIVTVFERDEATWKVLPGRLKLAETALLKSWLVTEKVDGTNIRIGFGPDRLTYNGRTEQAQLYAPLLAHLMEALPLERVKAAFDPDTTGLLFGEGYGD